VSDTSAQNRLFGTIMSQLGSRPLALDMASLVGI